MKQFFVTWKRLCCVNEFIENTTHCPNVDFIVESGTRSKQLGGTITARASSKLSCIGLLGTSFDRQTKVGDFPCFLLMRVQHYISRDCLWINHFAASNLDEFLYCG